MEVAAVFTHGMVLQQGICVPIWGTVTPGSRLTVQFAGQEALAIADGAGHWMARLQPLAASATPASLEVISSAGDRREGSALWLSFDHVDGGLVCQGETLKGFTLAGRDGRFVWATARIQGEQVVVSSLGIAQPESVRYAWGDNPDAPLYNAAGLPASPFRAENIPS